MALEDYRSDMETCRRCSACKFIPLERAIGYDLVTVCPSIARYDFHTYSGGGRMVFGVALLENRIDYSDKLLEVVYNCQVCGACDVSCKYAMDMEVIDPINELRIKCVEEGHTLPALDSVINSLRKQGTMVPGARAKRGDWAAGLDVKNFTEQPAKVAFHAGCRTCYDEDMWKVAGATISLLQKAGVDVGIGGEEESGGAGLSEYIKKNKADLATDAIVVSDTAMFDENTPAVTYGLRGLVTMEVTARTANRDLHSGIYGGVIANSVSVLSHIISKCTGTNGKIQIPGFYDNVRPLDDWEKENIRRLALRYLFQ